MVFRMATLDLTQNLEDDLYPPSSTSSSSTEVCCTGTFTVALVASTLVPSRRKEKQPSTNIGTEEDTTLTLPQGGLTRFSFKELQVATNNFSRENMIGRGSFGQVYRGTLVGGYAIAVKRSKGGPVQGLQFSTEVRVGNIPNHRNVAPLLGFCTQSTSETTCHFLVYPFLVNLSLAFQLRERPESMPPLNWQTRKKIALGVAQGLSHLHGLNIIHRDIKAANVLLDERYEPLITDFGLALFLGDGDQTTVQVTETRENHNISSTTTAEETEHTTAVRGTIGHIAPEYLSTGRCSRKIDVFGFGIMLLELISGQRAFDLARRANDEDAMLLDWIKGYLREGRLERIVDENMEGNYDESVVKLLVVIALLCTQSHPSERPNMQQVIQLLQVNEFDEIWQDRNHILLDARDLSNGEVHDGVVFDSSTLVRAEELSGPR